MAARVTTVDHPLVQHKLSLMRRTDTGSFLFRTLAREVGMLMAFEVTRGLSLTTETIETPLQPMEAPVLEGRKPVLVAILRAGIGMLDGIHSVLPTAKVGHVGMYRDAKTLEAHEYYFKMPPAMQERDVWLIDPMLATANTAIASTRRVKEVRPRSMKFVCLLAAPEGIERFHSQHPDVEIVTAAVDERLNEKGYILQGLGDAGDRLFGT